MKPTVVKTSRLQPTGVRNGEQQQTRTGGQQLTRGLHGSMSILHMLQAVPQGNTVKGRIFFYSYEAGFDCQSGFARQARIHLRTKNLPSGITSAQQEGAIATTDIQNTSSLSRSGNLREHADPALVAITGGKAVPSAVITGIVINSQIGRDRLRVTQPACLACQDGKALFAAWIHHSTKFFAEHSSARVAAKGPPLLGGKDWRVQVQVIGQLPRNNPETICGPPG